MQIKKLFQRLTIVILSLTVPILPVSSIAAHPLVVIPIAKESTPDPFAACTIGGPGTNYGNAEVEPWVAVNPTNPNNIVAVWQQDRWSNGAARGLITGVTHDGGVTWSKTWAHFSQCAGGNAANGGNYARASDPWLAFAPNGDLYQSSLSVTFTNLATAVLVSKSTNGGDTWNEPITVSRDTDHRFFNDKESITADPTDFHYVYAVWDRVINPKQGQNNSEQARAAGIQAPAMFARTTDAGQTWEAARILYDPGANNTTIANQLVVEPDGTLVAFFSESRTAQRNGKAARPDVSLALVRSSDKGATWGKVVRASKETFRDALDPDTRKPIRAEGIIPDVAVDARNSNLYAVWQDARFRNVNEIAFIMSTDDGDTWSTPIKVNQTPTSTNTLNQQAFLPAVHVAANGIIAVTYYDFRNNTPAPGVPTDYWIAYCRPSNTTPCTDPIDWQQENHLAHTTFDIEQAPVASGPSGFFIGDYQGLTNIENSFLAVFVQVNNGNPNNRTGVFYTRITPPSNP